MPLGETPANVCTSRSCVRQNAGGPHSGECSYEEGTRTPHDLVHF